MGTCSAPDFSARASRRASKAGDSTARRRAASARDCGPGGGTFTSGSSPLTTLTGRASAHDLVPAATLRFVELRVGSADQIEARLVRVGEHRDADRDRHGDRVSLEDEAARLDLLAQTIRQGARAVEARLGEYDRELLA